jgi:hypothetical protein
LRAILIELPDEAIATGLLELEDAAVGSPASAAVGALALPSDQPDEHDETEGEPWSQILLGNVLVEVSAWSTPCAKNAPWFADGDFTRIDHELHPGWSRAYAWVREPGTLRPGDPAIVEP